MRPLQLLVVMLVLLGLIVPHAFAEGEETEFFVRVTTPAFELTSTTIRVAEYALNDAPGAPELPVYGTVIELPATGDWSLSISSPGSRLLGQRVALRAVPIPQPRQPSPHGWQNDPGDVDNVAVINQPDSLIYGQDAFYPASPVVAGSEQWQRGRRLLAVRVFPFQYNPVTGEVIYHPDLTVTIRMSPTETIHAGPDQSTISSASLDQEPTAAANELGALRLRIGQRGMHRLTYTDLTNAGVPVVSVNPASFVVTYLGQPVQIQVTGADDGHFDSGDLVIFYAEPYTGRWMASNVYRFGYGTDAAAPETRMATRAVTPTGTEPVVTTVSQTFRIEQNKVYYSDYSIPTETDHIFDNPLYPNPTNGKVITRAYDLALDDPAPLGDMQIQGLLYGGSDQAPNPDIWAKMQVNGHEVGVYTWNGRQPYSINGATAPVSWLDQPSNKLNLVADLNNFPTLSEYWYNPDFIEITYPAYADAEGDRINILDFEVAATTAEMRVTGFSTSAVKVYDVRDARNPAQLLTTAAEPINGATQISFWDAWAPSAPKPAYSLSTDAALLAPTAIEVDLPTNWKSPDHEADYIAIVHRSLWDAVQPLLDRRAAEGLLVAKIDVQDIYDEFNDGHLHQNAIRDFLSYAYHNWNGVGPRPKYAVLVGDATPDYKKNISTSLQNLVPAFLINIDPWIIETAADNRFVSFDGSADYLPELIVSRISAQNATEVTSFVDKVAAYEDKVATPDGDWQNRVVYVADINTDPAGHFHDLSDDIRLNWLPSSYESRTVYYKSSASLDTGSEMRAAIKQAFNDTELYLQWFGHASRFRWGGETSMWNINDPPTLNANTKLPFVAAYSCWDGYFINMDSNYPALAEKHLLQQGRGSIGNLSPSGKHVGSALSILDQGLTKAIFQDSIAATGDAVDAAKLYYFANSSAWHDVIDTSILFGDPALKLRLPMPQIGILPGPGASVDLTWQHLEPYSSYQVWRGTLPYFDPTAEGVQVGVIDAEGAAYAVGDPVTYTDDGAKPPPPVTVIGDPATNYYWIVRGVNLQGVSGSSNRVGAFDFALIRGN